MDKSNWLCTRMIVMSLDVSKDHVLKKIMNNLNWSSEDTNVYFAYYIYRGILVLLIQILQQSQAYNLYLREGAISPDHLKMLTPHQGSGECSLLKITILYIKETNLQFFFLKRRFFQQLNMKISQEPLIWRKVWRYIISFYRVTAK